MSLFSLIRGFIKHWLSAVDLHSLHAPFVYNLYTDIILKDEPQAVFDEIEKYRTAYLQDKNKIKVQSPGAPSQTSRKQERSISNIAKKGITSARYGRLLYRLGKAIQPEVIIELGTSLGISALYLSLSNPQARVYTFEGCPQTAAQARRLFSKWPYQNIKLVEGNIDDTLPACLSTLEKKVGLAYLDANHRYEPTVTYYEQLLAQAHEGSIFVLDDIYWSNEMYQAWQTLYLRPEVRLSLDLFEVGILLFKEKHVKEHHALRY